jgi:multidrug efflux pump subunit AcrA (membrane-fusion protein)
VSYFAVKSVLIRTVPRGAPAAARWAPAPARCGRFEPRAVKLGRRGDGYVEVLDGVNEGEEVVTAATFLIDAESNLKAALQAFTQPETAK